MTLSCSPGGDPLRPLDQSANSDAPTAALLLVEGLKATVSVPVHAGWLSAKKPVAYLAAVAHSRSGTFSPSTLRATGGEKPTKRQWRK